MESHKSMPSSGLGTSCYPTHSETCMKPQEGFSQNVRKLIRVTSAHVVMMYINRYTIGRTIDAHGNLLVWTGSAGYGPMQGSRQIF